MFRTAKIGCRSKIYFCCKGDRLQVGRYEIKHNHEINPQNHCGQLKVPVGKNHRKKPSNKVDLNLVANTTRFGQYDNDYDIIPASETDNIEHPSKSAVKSGHWCGASNDDLCASIAEACDISHPRLSKISSTALMSRLEFSFDNLRSLATSGGVERLFTCLQYLDALESKWRQEFGQNPTTSGISEATADPSTFLNSDIPRSPKAARTISREILPTDFSQPMDVEQSEVEYVNRSWFYE